MKRSINPLRFFFVDGKKRKSQTDHVCLPAVKKYTPNEFSSTKTVLPHRRISVIDEAGIRRSGIVESTVLFFHASVGTGNYVLCWQLFTGRLRQMLSLRNYSAKPGSLPGVDL